jgi:hypothetical protein
MENKKYKEYARSIEEDFVMLTCDEILEEPFEVYEIDKNLDEELRKGIIDARIKRYQRYKNADTVRTAIEALFMLSGLVIVSLVTSNVLIQVNVGYLSLLAGYSACGSIQNARIYDEAIKAIKEKKGMILAKVK